MRRHFSKNQAKIIGQRLRKLRKNYHLRNGGPRLRLEDVGAWIGVKASMMSQIEKGTKGTTIQKLMILADKLEVPPVVLLTGKKLSKRRVDLELILQEILDMEEENPEQFTSLESYVKFLTSTK